LALKLLKKMKNNNFNQEIVWLLNEKYGGQLTVGAEKDIARLKRGEPPHHNGKKSAKRGFRVQNSAAVWCGGEPVDYVISRKNFCGCQIDLRYKPFIPRDETEYWIKQVIAEITKGRPRGGAPRSALDMFAGSGCCGIAVLKNIPNAHCDFADIDDNCLKQIRLNLKINGIDKKRYRIIKSDVFEKIKGRYDLILANPPYIGLGQKKKVQKSVLDFEPKQALFAKDNGLFFIKKFLSEAKNYLANKGLPPHHNGDIISYESVGRNKEAVWCGGGIYLEFGYNQKRDIEKLLKKFGYQNYIFNKDQFGKWRYLKIEN